MKKKFAKLFEFDGEQVLVVRSENDENERPQVVFTASFEYGMMDTKIVVEKDDTADRIFESVNEEMALKKLDEMRQAANALGLK